MTRSGEKNPSFAHQPENSTLTWKRHSYDFSFHSLSVDRKSVLVYCSSLNLKVFISHLNPGGVEHGWHIERKQSTEIRSSFASKSQHISNSCANSIGQWRRTFCLRDNYGVLPSYCHSKEQNSQKSSVSFCYSYSAESASFFLVTEILVFLV